MMHELDILLGYRDPELWMQSEPIAGELARDRAPATQLSASGADRGSPPYWKQALAGVSKLLLVRR